MAKATTAEQQAIKWAYETGAFWASGSEVDWPHLATLDPASPEVLAAVEHVRQMHPNERAEASYDVYAPELTPSEGSNFDPADLLMADTFESQRNPTARCPLPDVAPPPNAMFRYDDLDVQRAVLKMQSAAASGSGSWPAGCWVDGLHVVVIAVDRSRMPAHVADVWEAITATHRAMCAEVGLVVRYVAAGERADIRLRWKVLAGSTIGLAEFPDGSCEDEVFHYLDPGYRGDVDLLTTLHAHECGHNWGLGHRPRGIMTPSIRRVPLHWADDAGHAETMARFFGGDPVVDPADTPPVVPPDAGEVEVARWDVAGYSYRVMQRPAGGDPNPPPSGPPVVWGRSFDGPGPA